jgi:hypothetical protein
MTTGESGMSRSGGLIFAVTLFFVLGAMNIIYGIAILANAEWVVFTESGAWLLDFTTWGWITLLLGVLEVLTGWGLLNMSGVARGVGIVIAVIAAINALFIIPIYAVWGILAFAVSLIVIYALSAADQA